MSALPTTTPPAPVASDTPGTPARARYRHDAISVLVYVFVAGALVVELILIVRLG